MCYFFEEIISIKSVPFNVKKMSSTIVVRKSRHICHLIQPVSHLCMGRSMSGPYNLKNRLNPSTAVKWVNALTSDERQYVLVALQKKQAEESAKSGAQVSSVVDTVASTGPARPTNSDLYRLAIQQGLPFVGFGFLDNFIMIVAGESIETFFGTTLVISTMAAAALGNTLSDVFGIG